MMKLFSRSPQKEVFRTRAPGRDLAGDRALIETIERAIDEAMHNLQAQKDGLATRMQDALDRASVTVGNDTYEQETRASDRTEALRKFENELAGARARLSVVEGHLTNMEFVRSVFLSRFPNPKSS